MYEWYIDFSGHIFPALFTGNRITTEYGMQHAQILS